MPIEISHQAAKSKEGKVRYMYLIGGEGISSSNRFEEINLIIFHVVSAVWDKHPPNKTANEEWHLIGMAFDRSTLTPYSIILAIYPRFRYFELSRLQAPEVT